MGVLILSSFLCVCGGYIPDLMGTIHRASMHCLAFLYCFIYLLVCFFTSLLSNAQLTQGKLLNVVSV